MRVCTAFIVLASLSCDTAMGGDDLTCLFDIGHESGEATFDISAAAF